MNITTRSLVLRSRARSGPHGLRRRRRRPRPRCARCRRRSQAPAPAAPRCRPLLPPGGRTDPVAEAAGDSRSPLRPCHGMEGRETARPPPRVNPKPRSATKSGKSRSPTSTSRRSSSWRCGGWRKSPLGPQPGPQARRTSWRRCAAAVQYSVSERWRRRWRCSPWRPRSPAGAAGGERLVLRASKSTASTKPPWCTMTAPTRCAHNGNSNLGDLLAPRRL